MVSPRRSAQFMPHSSGGGSSWRNGDSSLIGLAAAVALSTAPPEAELPITPIGVERVALEIVQMTVQQIIIRVPRRDGRVPAMSNAGWRETSGPRCIPARQIAGAMPAASTVDLLMRDNSRIRARLGRGCAALDYYRGLYVNANADGQLCAGRDEIRSRMGGQCEIVQFRQLRPLIRER